MKIFFWWWNGGNYSFESEEEFFEIFLGINLNFILNGNFLGKIVGFFFIIDELDKKGSMFCILFMDEDLMIDYIKKMLEYMK